MEKIFENLSPERFGLIFSALIGAISAILIMIVKDIIIYGIRHKHERSRSLIDRKLSSIYGPIYTVCITADYQIAEIFRSDFIFEKYVANMHLLSKELIDLINQYQKLGTGDYRDLRFTMSNREESLDVNLKFRTQLIKEITELRNRYEK